MRKNKNRSNLEKFLANYPQKIIVKKSQREKARSTRRLQKPKEGFSKISKARFSTMYKTAKKPMLGKNKTKEDEYVGLKETMTDIQLSKDVQQSLLQENMIGFLNDIQIILFE
mmetsp:Transcript_33060/g.29297  ORF Transcript_33060/g.29297 Transcript_33060/m.29297 type:complete len:113 (+) Transcript_33060:259-597(+)